MSGHIRYEVGKTQFGVVRLLSPEAQAKQAASTMMSALELCLNTKITYRRKGWFGPKIAHLTYMGQVIELKSTAGGLSLDLLTVDDEARETILELMRHSTLFIRR